MSSSEKGSIKDSKSSTKDVKEHGPEVVRSVDSDAASNGGGVDLAWKFLDQHRDNANGTGEYVDLAALRRRIDFRIVPLMFLCYTLQFLDKVILNVRFHAPTRVDIGASRGPRRTASPHKSPHAAS